MFRVAKPAHVCPFNYVTFQLYRSNYAAFIARITAEKGRLECAEGPEARALPLNGLGRSNNPFTEVPEMLRWALIFFIVAIIAAVLGFGGVAGAAAGIAKILFFIFLILLVVSLVVNFTRGTSAV